MLVEALVALLVGLIVLWLVLEPMLRPSAPRLRPAEPIDPEETPKGIALAALKEIEFDRETGKLSDADYQLLKTKYTAEALEAMREEPVAESDDVEALVAARARALRFAPTTTSPVVSALSGATLAACPACGPRPEPDARFCSSCGHRLPGPANCRRCGAALGPDSRFCESCGHQVAA
jgi:rRNA maturation endonuclease Nob1